MPVSHVGKSGEKDVILKPHMMLRSAVPILVRLRQEDCHESEASLSKIVVKGHQELCIKTLSASGNYSNYKLFHTNSGT